MTGTLLTTLEVAERLGLSSAAVAQAVRTGALQPSARTDNDFLFTERAVAAYAERRSQATASPLQPPAAGSRSEWSGDVDRLNLWLKELTEVLPPSGTGAASPARPATVPAVGAPATDFRPPSPAARPAEPPPRPPVPEPTPEPVAEKPKPVDPELAAEPEPAPIVARSLLERIAAAGPVATPPPAEPIPAAPEPVLLGQPPRPAPAAVVPGPEPEARVPEAEPVVPTPEPEPVAAPAPVAAAPGPDTAPAPVAIPVGDPVPAAVAKVAAPPSSPGPDLSPQAVLVVQPIVRFRVLRDVTERLATIRGISDARLERLEGGVASYRVSFEGERPSGEAIGEALAALNLEVILVDSFL